MKSISLRIMNYSELVKLEQENSSLIDSAEGEARKRLIEAIEEAIMDYDAHILQYEQVQHWKQVEKRGVSFIPVERDKVSVIWEKMFFDLVSQERKDNTKHFSNQFLWHIFSFNLLVALCKEDANIAFDSKEKSDAYVFFQYADEAYLVQHAELLKAEDFAIDSDMNHSDVYVFDPENKWTYIKTHEDSCGPYFFQQ